MTWRYGEDPINTWSYYFDNDYCRIIIEQWEVDTYILNNIPCVKYEDEVIDGQIHSKTVAVDVSPSDMVLYELLTDKDIENILNYFIHGAKH